MQKEWFPNGWIINAYKHLNTPHSDFADTEIFFNSYEDDQNTFHNRRDIAYGNYDRIQLAPIDKFSEYSSKSNQSRGWFGSAQSLFLFPIEGNVRCFGWDINIRNGMPKLCLNDSEVTELNDFFAVSFCYISDELRSLADSYEALLKDCRNAIIGLVNAFNNSLEKENPRNKLHRPIIAEVFGSFSSAEIVILWSTKQYTDVLYLMDCLRDLCCRKNGVSFSMFRTTYTMISFPDVIAKGTEQDANLAEIQGDAYIQFVMQDGRGEKYFTEFEEFLRQAIMNSGMLMQDTETPLFSLRRCVGEYDFAVDVKSKYIPRLFSNPENWNQIDLTQKSDEPKYYFCSVHHPKYNRYVLYSFTRLGYTQKDLPLFTCYEENSEAAQLWKCAKRAEISVGETKEEQKKGPEGCVPLFRRSALICEIERYRKGKFAELIDLVAQRLPSISNLSTELHQIFDDYVQCCCASADYLWIEDYNELFRQTMDGIFYSVQKIEVWKNFNVLASSAEDWKSARGRTKKISTLIQALQQQISHISASNKLFFKEQDIHFGYTAQHDLVIHAYYDIIKRLIEYIYNYSNTAVQSSLYPLVNFCPENRIVSEIFTQESAEDFLHDCRTSDGQVLLRPRIMVIQIPLDGMDNLMHYLPMMVHEVYHYAAPIDRMQRNLLLAKISVFQTASYSFLSLFEKILQRRLKKKAQEDKADLDLLLPGTVEELLIQFRCLVDPVLYQVVEKSGEAILTGLKEHYFFAESESKVSPDFLENVQILRSWFQDWLYNWLNDVQKRRGGENTKKEPGQAQYNNFSDLFPLMFNAVAKVLEQEKEKRAFRAGSKAEVYFRSIEELSAQIQQASEPNKNDSQDAIRNPYQQIAECAAEYVNEKSELTVLWNQLNEIFPDLAMVELVKMPAAGYMLQIALDCDKQLYYSQFFYENKLRVAVIVHYLLNKDEEADPAKQEHMLDRFNEAVEEFVQMYIASYCLPISKEMTREEYERCARRAEKWEEMFRAIYLSYPNKRIRDSFQPISPWVRELLETQMLPCLQIPANFEDVHHHCFVKPYHDYLDILKDYREEKAQDRLFHLNIKTILQFQRHKSIKEIHKKFTCKGRCEGICNSKISKCVHAPATVVLSKSYENRCFSIENYYTAILHAFDQLYQFRQEEGISSATGIWYRGVSNAKYPILPSGFVHFSEDARRLNPQYPNCPYFYLQAQRHNYESFRYAAEGSSPEINPSQYSNSINYLTLMQHYSQHTNLLDWSEDFSASTYFALEEEININDKYDYERAQREKNLPNRNVDAALYLLDPIRLNRACSEIEREIAENSLTTNVQESEEVPNLSIEKNQARFECYHEIYQGPPRLDRIMVKGTHKPEQEIRLYEVQNFLQLLKPEERPHIHLPRAIYTAKLNPRIRAQSGLFVGFSLDSIPAVWEDEVINTEAPSANLFYYQSLEAIQEYYLSMKHKSPFLMKIIIPAGSKEEMGRIFYRLGISRERIYPELQNNRNR